MVYSRTTPSVFEQAKRLTFLLRSLVQPLLVLTFVDESLEDAFWLRQKLRRRGELDLEHKKGECAIIGDPKVSLQCSRLPKPTDEAH